MPATRVDNDGRTWMDSPSGGILLRPVLEQCPNHNHHNTITTTAKTTPQNFRFLRQQARRAADALCCGMKLSTQPSPTTSQITTTTTNNNNNKQKLLHLPLPPAQPTRAVIFLPFALPGKLDPSIPAYTLAEVKLERENSTSSLDLDDENEKDCHLAWGSESLKKSDAEILAAIDGVVGRLAEQVRGELFASSSSSSSSTTTTVAAAAGGMREQVVVLDEKMAPIEAGSWQGGKKRQDGTVKVRPFLTYHTAETDPLFVMVVLEHGLPPAHSLARKDGEDGARVLVLFAEEELDEQGRVVMSVREVGEKRRVKLEGVLGRERV